MNELHDGHTSCSSVGEDRKDLAHVFEERTLAEPRNDARSCSARRADLFKDLSKAARVAQWPAIVAFEISFAFPLFLSAFSPRWYISFSCCVLWCYVVMEGA